MQILYYQINNKICIVSFNKIVSNLSNQVIVVIILKIILHSINIRNI